MDACRAAVEALRRRIADGELDGDAVDAELRRPRSPTILHRLNSAAVPRTREVINATGVLLHTNLGRAPLAQSAARLTLASYLALEYDIDAGPTGPASGAAPGAPRHGLSAPSRRSWSTTTPPRCC